MFFANVGDDGLIPLVDTTEQLLVRSPRRPLIYASHIKVAKVHLWLEPYDTENERNACLNV